MDMKHAALTAADHETKPPPAISVIPCSEDELPDRWIEIPASRPNRDLPARRWESSANDGGKH
jgi:hypothetical protein